MKTIHRLKLAKWVLIFGTVALPVFVLWRMGWLDRPQPTPTPEVILSQAERACLITLLYDDSETDSQIIDMAFAATNLAKELGRTVCDIYTNTLEFSAPSQQRDVLSLVRQKAFMDLMSKTSDARQAWRAKVTIAVDSFEKERARYLAERPERQCFSRFLRSYKRPLSWPDETLMRREMGPPIFTDEKGAMFFGKKCPSSKRDSTLRPPGVPPPGRFLF